MKETSASVAQSTDNTNTSLSISYKSNNINTEKESQTSLSKLKTLIRASDCKAMENHYLQAFPKQVKNQDQGKNKSKIEKQKHDF